MEEKDYITKSALRRALHNEVFEADSKEQRWEDGCWIRYRLIDKIISDLPSADVRPVKRGEWVYFGVSLDRETGEEYPVYFCSKCGIMNYVGNQNFCYFCGADMRPKEDNHG